MSKLTSKHQKDEPFRNNEIRGYYVKVHLLFQEEPESSHVILAECD